MAGLPNPASAKRFKLTYDELVAREKASLDITWLRDESREDTETFLRRR